MKIAVGQINPVIGDFSANRQSICTAAVQALNEGARIIVFPELSLCGYPPMDLLEHQQFIEANTESLRQLQHELPHEIAVVVGLVERAHSQSGKAIVNSAVVLLNGAIIHSQQKTLLPTYDVFDEARYFEPAHQRTTFILDETIIGIAICEDMWWETEPAPGTRYPIDPVRDLLDQGARVILCPSASPFVSEKIFTRLHVLKRAGASGAAVVYCNMVGANDNLIFDGRSLITDRHGTLLYSAPAFTETVGMAEISLTDSQTASIPEIMLHEDRYEMVYHALVLGIRDYMRKTGFSRAHIGLSGGIDSALVAVLASAALNPENITCILLPSKYSSEHSLTDARQLASNLGTNEHTIPIHDSVASLERAMSTVFSGTSIDTTEENIQARVRGNVLMAYSNKFHSLLLTTGNKSELAVGYCTLYGDMCGSLSVIGDLLKTEVYELCRWINRKEEIIPASILSKPPSAELRPNQTDQDSLPEYDQLDAILTRYIMHNRSAASIIEEGFPEAAVLHIVKLTARSEYKRRQAPPVLKVSSKAFGTGRRIPIARALFELG